MCKIPCPANILLPTKSILFYTPSPENTHPQTFTLQSMADVSFLHDDDDNEDRHDSLVSISHWPDDLQGFDVFPPDLDSPSSQDLFCGRRRCLDRETQANCVIDMFHQRVEQSQSQSQSQSQLHSTPRVIEENHLIRSDGSLGVVEGNEDVNSNEFEVDFESELGFHVENNDNHNPNSINDDAYSGFMVAGDQFSNGAQSESSRSSIDSGAPEYIMGGLSATDIVSDSFESGEVEIDSAMAGETNLHLCWDAFHLDDDDDHDHATLNPNNNINGDFDWEEVDERIDGRELNMFFGAEADDDASVLPGITPGNQETLEEQEQEEHEGEEDRDGLEWEVLLNVQNFESNQDISGDYDEYNYTEYEMFFGQFADSDLSSLGRPPASRKAVENLATVVISEEDVEKNTTTFCAVCKDEMGVGEMAKLLPCKHRYHGDCIVPWLEIRNTCPVCRYELPTDDVDYERKKVERGVHG